MRALYPLFLTVYVFQCTLMPKKLLGIKILSCLLTRNFKIVLFYSTLWYTNSYSNYNSSVNIHIKINPKNITFIFVTIKDLKMNSIKFFVKHLALIYN